MTLIIKTSLINVITWGFKLLYHQFAWMYNFAAWLVSAGRWNDWVRETGRFATKSPLLDIGCGQGVLLEQAARNTITAYGLDESPQMLRRSQKRLPPTAGYLIRGVGQAMPFAGGSFQTITATFPAPYLFELTTLNEIRRVLASDGRVIILLAAVVTGSSLHEYVLRSFGKFFGFAPLSETILQRFLHPLHQAGFDSVLNIKETNHSKLFFILARLDN